MVSKKERILETIKNLREFKFCGPSDDPDEQTAVCVGYHYGVTQLKRMVASFIPESIGKSLNSIEVNMNDLYNVYEARAEIDALLPDIESIIQGLDESVFDRDKVCLDGVKSVAGKMIPTAGQFRKLAAEFHKKADSVVSPRRKGLSHTLRLVENYDMDVTSDDESERVPDFGAIEEYEKAIDQKIRGLYYPFGAYEIYCEPGGACIGYLTKSWQYQAAAYEGTKFIELAETAGSLLKKIPNELLNDIGAFSGLKRDSYDINLWLVFLHEFEGNQLKEKGRNEVKHVYLKSALACEYLAERLEKANAEQNSDNAWAGKKNEIETKSSGDMAEKVCFICGRPHNTPLTAEERKKYEDLKKSLQDMFKLSDNPRVNLLRLEFGLPQLNSTIERAPILCDDALSELKYLINLIKMCKELALGLSEENFKQDVLLILLKLERHFDKMDSNFDFLKKHNIPSTEFRRALQEGCEKAVSNFGTALEEAASRCSALRLLVERKPVTGGKTEAENTTKTEQKIESIGMQPELIDTEQNIIETLGKNTMKGEPLAKKAGYPCNSNFKGTLSSLRKRGILGNKSPGYFLEPKYYGLLKKSDQGQDKGQD